MPTRIKKAQRAFDRKDIKLVKQAHSNELIKNQIHEEESSITKGHYLGEFVYGSIDGTVTTFAVVAGATGASLSPAIVIHSWFC